MIPEDEPVVFGRALADVQQGEFVWIVPMDPANEFVVDDGDGDYVIRASPLTFWLVLLFLVGIVFWVGWLAGFGMAL